ncbi:MAG: DUF2071 domain-containing protein [Bryobacterales bacterium]|nr:DUF2071 domain-containing protein [Bryobacterales bacterium]
MSAFLTATWSQLVMLNYEVPPEAALPYVPRGVEPDTFEGRTLVSIVGFLFDDTRVCGAVIPFHRRFEEVNLRLYVRYRAESGWRRGVVFVKEIVPRFFVALLANRLYNERYVSLPMRHAIEPGRRAQYSWRFQGRWNSIEAAVSGEPYTPACGSEEEFITEHYWGYTAQKDGGTLEYQVEHPRWRVWKAREARFDCDVSALYGSSFAVYMKNEPSSAFLAESSAVTVHAGKRII